MDARRTQLSVIEDMMGDYESSHSILRWRTKYSQIKEDEWLKMYVSFNHMSKVINELVTLAPVLDKFNTEQRSKIKLLKKTLSKEHLDWYQMSPNFIKRLENKDGIFLTFSTDKDTMVDGIPPLKILENENMEDILINPITKETEAYIYKETLSRETLDENTGKLITVDSREVTWIYAKGYTRVNDPLLYSYTSKTKQCSDCLRIIPNEQELCNCSSKEFNYGFRIFKNKPDYADMINVIYIPSYIDKGDKFCKIPAIEYVDDCLLLSNLYTLRHNIIQKMSFPIVNAMGCRLDDIGSSLIAGGIVYWDADKEWLMNGKMPMLKTFEISNELTPLTENITDVITDLYKKVCLIREGMEQTLAGSDSSRNSNQLRLGIEMKVKHYFKNIIEGMATYFRVVLRENGLLSDKEFKEKKQYTFEIPDILINNSMFEQFLLLQQKRALGKSTLVKEMRQEGFEDAEIEKRKEEITEELYGKNNDMEYSGSKEVNDIVSNSNNASDDIKGLDNNFK